MNYNQYYNPYLQNQQNNGFMGVQNQQNNGFIGVQNEQEARFYPVAPGNSMTFRDESAPYIYTKTMGRSQLDRPTFEKYRLVKEEAAETATETAEVKESIDFSIYALKDDLVPITEQISALQKEIAGMKTKKKVIREVEVDDE